MRKYTFSLSKEGYEATDPDPNHKLLDADYPFFKFHDDLTGSVTFTPGDTEKYIDLTHNLGYVPAFIAYGEDFNGKQRFIPGIPWGTGFTQYAYAWADTTKIRCGVSMEAYNTYNSTQGSPPGGVTLYDDYWGLNSLIVVGKKDGNGRHGAMIFGSVTIPQGTAIVEALLHYAVQYKGAGAGDLQARIYGIDEDNTSSSGNPMGRTRTTAYDEANWSLPGAGSYSNHNITSIVQEIIDRGGWVSGNNLGVVIIDNGSPDGVWAQDDASSGIDSYLTITYGTNTTLTFRAIIFKDKIA